MAKITDITTGEQAVASAGAVTGSLDTSALGTFTGSIKLMVRGLSAGKKALFVIEDTANATPFADAIQVAAKHFVGGMPTEGIAAEWQAYDIPLTRFGASNTKLRLNCLSIDSSPGSVLAHAWLEQ